MVLVRFQIDTTNSIITLEKDQKSQNFGFFSFLKGIYKVYKRVFKVHFSSLQRPPYQDKWWTMNRNASKPL